MRVFMNKRCRPGRMCLLLFSILALAFTACSKDSNKGSTITSPPTSAAPNKTVEEVSAGSRDANTPSLDLRLLIIAETGSEPNVVAWQSMLETMGTPYDVVVAAAENLTPDRLAKGKRALYNGVVVISQKAWEALDQNEQGAIISFEQTFGVRHVTAYVYPNPSWGFEEALDPSGPMDDLVAAVTPEGKAALPGTTDTLPIDDQAWVYLAVAQDVTPLLTGPQNSTLMGVRTYDDGREELIGTFDSSEVSEHAEVLIPAMLSWVTKGVHLGFKRNYLALHVDDILLPNHRWDPATKQTNTQTDTPIRMTPEDAEAAAAWSAKTGIVFDFVYNGYGTELATQQNGNDPLLTTLLADKDKFRWINHTYSHLNLDNATAEQLDEEIAKNITFADENGIPIVKTELVTGEHSGLRNPNLPQALAKNNIAITASDHSVAGEPSQLLGNTWTVPRWPMNMYYDTGTREEQLDEFNNRYAGGSCVSECFEEPFSYEQYADWEADRILRILMSGNPDPHYLHQSNLAEDRVFYDVFDRVLERYKALTSLPIAQPDYSAIADIRAANADWANQLESGNVEAFVQNGQIVFVNAANKELRMPVTGAQGLDQYGAEISGFVDTKGNTATPVKVVS